MRYWWPSVAAASKAQAEARLELMANLPLSVDVDAGNQWWADAMLLAGAHRLAAYDAAYLELAICLDADLASLDQELRRAAKTMGVNVLP